MRWKVKVLKPLDTNQYQIVRKFLLFPKCLDNEWRWLEWANILQISRVKYDTWGLGAVAHLAWIDWSWKD